MGGMGLNTDSCAHEVKKTMEKHAPRTKWNETQRNKPPTLAQMYRPERRSFLTDKLVDLYFFVNLEGNLGVIRRDLINKLFRGTEDIVLNFN